MDARKEAVWKMIAPVFDKKEFGEEADKINPEILFFIFLLNGELPAGKKIIINGASSYSIDFTIPRLNLLAAESLIQRFLRKYELETLVALGICPEWGDGELSGFHIELEDKIKERPRRWGMAYKRNPDGELFLREGKPVEERIAYEVSIERVKKAMGGQPRI
jgi:hypothetical protein